MKILKVIQFICWKALKLRISDYSLNKVNLLLESISETWHFQDKNYSGCFINMLYLLLVIYFVVDDEAWSHIIRPSLCLRTFTGPALSTNRKEKNHQLTQDLWYNLFLSCIRLTSSQCDQQCLHLLQNKCFWLLLQYYGSVQTPKTCYKFICVAFKSHVEWSNAQVSTPTITILPSTAGNFYSLNCFDHTSMS